MAQDAIRGYIESLRKDHLPIPSDKTPVKEEVRVLLPEPAWADGSLRSSPKTYCDLLERAGFKVHHVTGSHYILKHPEKPP
jgi:hypothetical protein